MKILYGLAVVVLIYLALYYFYSVHYVAGSALYGSPVTQLLFPGERSMHPTWGYNKLGMIHPDPTKHGQDTFWPQHVPYQAKKSGSGGPNPEGGERGSKGYYPGVELREGYDPVPTIQNIYDDSGIPEKKVWSVGWWGY
jgi:hypothetical protein